MNEEMVCSFVSADVNGTAIEKEQGLVDVPQTTEDVLSYLKHMFLFIKA